MKGLLEKIKSLDKKILIGAGAGLAALIIAVVVILVVCLGGKDKDTYKEDDKTKVEQNDDKDKDEDKEDESDDKEEAIFTVKVVDADGAAVAGVTVQVCKEECIPATTDETGVATFNIEITEGYKLSVVTCPEGYEYTGEAEVALEAGIKEYTLNVQKKEAEESNEGTGNSSNSSGQTATQLGTTTKEDGTEVLGEGSKSNPCMLDFIGESMTVTTISIPAGKEMYFGIYKIGNLILTINNPDAYVIESNGTRHDASNGKVSFQVENALPSDAVYFTIGNKGTSAAVFTIQRENPIGSMMNPTVLTSLSNTHEASVKSEDQQGYFYKYVAQQGGSIRFYLKSDDAILRVTNNRSYQQEVVEAANGYIDLKVKPGDEIIINVARTDGASGTIIWSGQYK